MVDLAICSVHPIFNHAVLFSRIFPGLVHSKDLMEENKALEIDIKAANTSPEFAKAIFVQAHQLIALEQKQMGAFGVIVNESSCFVSLMRILSPSLVRFSEEARKKAEQDQKAIAEKKTQPSPSDDEAKLKRDEEKRARIAQELLDEEEQQKQKAELRKRGGTQQSPAPAAAAAAAAAAPVAVTPSKVAASGKLNVVDPVVTPGSGKKKK
jgi:hypothetical protein